MEAQINSPTHMNKICIFDTPIRISEIIDWAYGNGCDVWHDDDFDFDFGFVPHKKLKAKTVQIQKPTIVYLNERGNYWLRTKLKMNFVIYVDDGDLDMLVLKFDSRIKTS